MKRLRTGTVRQERNSRIIERNAHNGSRKIRDVPGFVSAGWRTAYRSDTGFTCAADHDWQFNPIRVTSISGRSEDRTILKATNINKRFRDLKFTDEIEKL